VEVIDLERLKKQTTELPGLIEYAHSSSGAVIRPEDRGLIKAQGLSAMRLQTQREIQQLCAQMQPLIEQANFLKKRIEISELVYDAELGFKPVMGHMYYLYQKKDPKKEEKKTIVSIIAPEQWNNCPYDFIAKIQLLPDHTWDYIE